MLDTLSELSACLNARYLHAFDLASAEADVYRQPADAGMATQNRVTFRADKYSITTAEGGKTVSAA